MTEQKSAITAKKEVKLDGRLIFDYVEGLVDTIGFRTGEVTVSEKC
jgi:hypothetical protein